MKVFAYVIKSKLKFPFVRHGELNEIAPLWDKQIPWKCKDEDGNTKIFNSNHTNWEKRNEENKKSNK